MTDADEWARWDADNLIHHAGRLSDFYARHGRLPFPCAGRVRRVHDMLGEMVAGLDDKMKEVA